MMRFAIIALLFAAAAAVAVLVSGGSVAHAVSVYVGVGVSTFFAIAIGYWVYKRFSPESESTAKPDQTSSEQGP